MQKYVLNPPAKASAYMGLLPGHLMLETRGRKSGKRRVTVVGYHDDSGVLWVVAEQGRHAGYVRNLEADRRVRVRLKGRWIPAEAEIAHDDDPARRLASFGRKGHERIVRSLGTSLLSLRVVLDEDGDKESS